MHHIFFETGMLQVVVANDHLPKLSWRQRDINPAIEFIIYVWIINSFSPSRKQMVVNLLVDSVGKL